MAKRQRIILGLIGNPGSGKTTIGRYLAKQHRFYYTEASEGVREYAQKKGVLLFSRREYGSFHRDLQKEFGKDVLAQRLLARPERRIVLAGVLCVANARTLQAAGGLIIALHCPLQKRFQRIDHAGLKYAKDIEDFKKVEASEFESPDGYGLEVKKVMQLADRTIDTTRTLEHTLEQIDAIVAELEHNASKQ